MSETIKVEVDLIEDGLLWLINKTVFHPRGFALQYNTDGTFTLWGDGDEPWEFGGPPEGWQDAKFRAVEAVLDKARKKTDG